MTLSKPGDESWFTVVLAAVICRTIALSWAAFTITWSPAAAAQLLLTREVIISQPRGASLLPNAIARADDGGYIIAGRINAAQAAWAAKTDAQGQVLWQYQTRVRDKLPIGQGAEFDGVAAMPDGSSYLCGHMPRTPGLFMPGLLTHLDPAGHVLSERLVIPLEESGPGVAYFFDCVRWGDGVAVVGRLLKFPEKGRRENLYLVVALGPSGDTKWEKLIPTTFDAIGDVGPSLVTAKSKLVFCGGRANLGTELFRVSETGELEIRKKLSGQFALVRPVTTDGSLQLYGYPSANAPFTTITVDDRFEEIRRTDAGRRLDFAAHLVYRMPDQSLVLFGSGIHAYGAQYTSRILYLDATLRSEQSIDLNRAPFSDSGFVKAALPTGNAGEFVVARNLIKLAPGDTRPVGAALDFVQIR